MKFVVVVLALPKFLFLDFFSDMIFNLGPLCLKFSSVFPDCILLADIFLEISFRFGRSLFFGLILGMALFVLGIFIFLYL